MIFERRLSLYLFGMKGIWFVVF
uniref:Uncharacterized protein n=1 Tax=Rhizophora mucronata TaxID=61149 RepID=A0A2P2KLZ4_RHIMU